MNEKELSINQDLILSQNEEGRAVVLDPINIKLFELNSSALLILVQCIGNKKEVVVKLKKQGFQEKNIKDFINRLKKYILILEEKNGFNLLENKQINELQKQTKIEKPIIKECDLSSGFFSKYLPQ